MNASEPRNSDEWQGEANEFKGGTAATESMMHPASAFLGATLRRFSLVIAASSLLLTSCETTSDPNQGGLLGWSPAQANQRISAREQHLADLERENAYGQQVRPIARPVASVVKRPPSSEDAPTNRVPDPTELKKEGNIIGQPGLENSAAKRVPDPIELKKDTF